MKDSTAGLSGRTLALVIGWTILLAVALSVAAYYAEPRLAPLFANPIPPAELHEAWIRYILPGVTLLLLFHGLMIWGFLQRSLRKQIRSATIKPRAAKTPSRKEESNVHARLFLHVLSVLQREGRLLDFLSEDLAPFEDAQIGAAVRNIHEGCNTALRKYLSPAPVTATAEGETMTVEPGFDPAAVKLIGNVVGEPPFQGVVKHRGWRVEKLQMPTFTETGDPKIIAPAEIEIE